MLVIAVLLPFARIGRHAAVGQVGQTSYVRVCAGSYEVTPPGRSRAYGTTQQADRSIERQQNRVRLAKGQTHRVMPYSSSLACDNSDGHRTVARGAPRTAPLTVPPSGRWTVKTRKEAPRTFVSMVSLRPRRRRAKMTDDTT